MRILRLLLCLCLALSLIGPAQARVVQAESDATLTAGLLMADLHNVISGQVDSGHALDQMQNRGVTPSIVVNTIRNGTPTPGNRPGTIEYVDHMNGVNVILNANGRVVTVK